MKFVVFSALAASLAFALTNDATPLGKVIEMLNDMKLKGEKDKKEEEVQFAAYKQFCEITEEEKNRVIADSKDKIEVVSAELEKSEADAAKHFPASLALRTGAGYAAALWREVHEKLTLAVALEVTTQSGRFWVATSHLFWDPKYPDLKLLQAWLLERELTALMGDDQPLILAGDLNSTPLLDGRSQGSAECECSGVYELLTRGKVEVSHPHHPVMLRPGSGILKGIQPEDVPEFQLRRFRSAQVEAGGGERATNVSADFVGCLDYILYRGEPLRLLRTRAMEELPRNAVLPSETPVVVLLIVQGWSRIEAQVPELAELHLEPSLLPAILGFFTYTVGKVLAGILK